MEKQLQLQLAEILKQIATTVSVVKDFSVAQLPDVAQQYIHYGFFTGILWVVITIAILVIAVIGIGSIVHEMPEVDDVGPVVGEIAFFCMLVLFFICIGSLISLYSAIQNLILNVTAPKVWLILELRKLIQ